SNGREDHLVDGGPAEFFEQLTGSGRTQRHAAEDHEVIERLNLVAFIWTMALRDHGRGADERQVPSEPEQREPAPKMRNRDAGDADHGGGGNQCQADAGDRLNPKTRDQRSGDKTWRIHCYYGLKPVSSNVINDLSSRGQSGTTHGTTASSWSEVGDHFGDHSNKRTSVRTRRQALPAGFRSISRSMVGE